MIPHPHHPDPARPISVAVLGVSGFAGAEVLRLLTGHPHATASFLGAHGSAGSLLGEVFPHLAALADRRLEPLDALDPATVDAALVALPPGRSAGQIPELVEAGVRVVDLGPDFRLPAGDYPGWYGFEHPAPAWLNKAVYGLTELHRAEVAAAALVANPGCYPSAAVLGLAPLLTAGALAAGHLIVDGVSGASGAGRSSDPGTQFAALDGSIRPYRVGRHQHTPEIERALATASAQPVVTFVPRLVPAVRGVATTAYAPLAGGEGDAGTLTGILEDAYRDEPFVRVVPPGAVPDPKRLVGTNVCEIGVAVDEHAGTAIVMGALDNLGKGAAGQAVQNLNVMFGLPETAGLATMGVYP